MGCPEKTLAVIIPSYRFDVNADCIISIVSLPYPEEWKVQFYIIGDNPAATVPPVLQQLIDNQTIIFHRNKINRGLSYSRNRGIDISTGALLLFLDDDVIPDKNLLLHYIHAAEQHPDAAGFGGVVHFPSPFTDFTHALVASGYTHFFLLASRQQILPWALGGNMMYRRETVRQIKFATEFGSNGGEEVDFAIHVKKQTGRSIIAVPTASMQHPWWSNGRPDFSRPLRYSRGNYYLLRRHPEFATLRFCNTPEIICLQILFFPLILWLGVYWGYWLLLMAGLLLADAVIHTIKLQYEKGILAPRQVLYSWLVKMAEQTGYLSLCLQKLYLPGLFKRFDIELTPGRRKHFHTNRWILAKMILISVSFLLLCLR